MIYHFSLNAVNVNVVSINVDKLLEAFNKFKKLLHF